MAEVARYKFGNSVCIVMDDFCSFPDQKERDANIRTRVEENALRAIRAHPEKYFAWLEKHKDAFSEEENSEEKGG